MYTTKWQILMTVEKTTWKVGLNMAAFSCPYLIVLKDYKTKWKVLLHFHVHIFIQKFGVLDELFRTLFCLFIISKNPSIPFNNQLKSLPFLIKPMIKMSKDSSWSALLFKHYFIFPINFLNFWLIIQIYNCKSEFIEISI